MEKNYPFLPEMVLVVVGIFLILLPSASEQTTSDTTISNQSRELYPQQSESDDEIVFLPPTEENLSAAIIIRRFMTKSGIRYGCNGNLFTSAEALGTALNALKQSSENPLHVFFDLQPETPGAEVQKLFSLCRQLGIPIVFQQATQPQPPKPAQP